MKSSSGYSELSCRAVVKAPKFCHVTPSLKSLHWLKVNERVEYKLISLTYKALTTAQPTFLHSPISVQRSCYSLLICRHPFSTTYIFFSKNHQSRVSLCISSSLESTSCLIPPALHKHPADDVTLSIHLQPTHHSHPPSHIHCFIPGSKLTCSTSLFHRSLLAPAWTAFSDYTGPDSLCSTIFSYFSFFSFWVVL